MRGLARLKPGDEICVVAPAGCVPRERFETGAKIVEQHFRLRYSARIFDCTGYLAGSDDARYAEIADFIADESVKAIWCARGGYGVTRLLPRLRRLQREQLPLVIGFSDITALHAWTFSRNTASVHGPVITQIGDLDGESVERLMALLQGQELAPLVGLSELRGGAARGRLFGGNLEVLSRLVGTAHMPSLDGTIVFLEEVGERPYRIDRALTQLLDAGAFDGVRGFVIGDLVRCEEPSGQGPTAEQVLVERLQSLGVPIAAGAPIGHGARNWAMPIGSEAELSVGVTSQLVFV